MEYWAMTDCGRVRTQNQDSFMVKRLSEPDGELLVAAVCDGMGGAKAGNVASAMAVERFSDAITDKLYSIGQAEALLRETVEESNRRIYDSALSEPDYEGMGTTMVAVITDGQRALIANVGDSRCYLIRGNAIRQITKDHSLVEDMVDRGEIDRAEAWRHPRRNFITRALGTEPEVQCDIFRLTLRQDDVLLMCSDGLSGVVNPQELLFEIVYGGELVSAVDRMVSIALERGAPDNVTAVLLADFSAACANQPDEDEQNG